MAPFSHLQILTRPNKKIGVFRGMDLRILGRVGHFLLIFFFSEKKLYNFMHFERNLPFKMHKIIFFPENLKKILGFTSKFR